MLFYHHLWLFCQHRFFTNSIPYLNRIGGYFSNTGTFTNISDSINNIKHCFMSHWPWGRGWSYCIWLCFAIIVQVVFKSILFWLYENRRNHSIRLPCLCFCVSASILPWTQFLCGQVWDKKEEWVEKVRQGKKEKGVFSDVVNILFESCWECKSIQPHE